MDRKAAIEAAILRLKPDQFTRDGKPSLRAINAYLTVIVIKAHLSLDDFDPITARERDELWAKREAEAATAGPANALQPSVVEHETPQPAPSADLGDPGVAASKPEPAPEGFTKIKLTSAQSDPVPLYVHGVGFWSIRVGEVVTLPVDALDALRNSDCTFTLE